jgi:hypothetical protein
MRTPENEKESSKKALSEKISSAKLSLDQIVLNLMAEETKDCDVLSVSYRPIFDCYCTVDIGIAELQRRLRKCMQFYVCRPSAGCSEDLWASDNLSKWVPTVGAISSCKSIEEFDKSLNLKSSSWLLFDWSSWKWQAGLSHTPTGHVDLDTYPANNEATFLFLVVLSRCDNQKNKPGLINGPTLMIMPPGVNCIMHSTLWRLLLTSPANKCERIQFDLRNEVLIHNPAVGNWF